MKKFYDMYLGVKGGQKSYKDVDGDWVETPQFNTTPITLEQSQKTQRPNALTLRLRTLFNQGTLTTWEFNEYIQMLRAFAKTENLIYDEKSEQLFEPKR